MATSIVPISEARCVEDAAASSSRNNHHCQLLAVYNGGLKPSTCDNEWGKEEISQISWLLFHASYDPSGDILACVSPYSSAVNVEGDAHHGS